MPPIPAMVQPSTFSTVAFLLVIAAVVVVALWGAYAAGRPLSEPPKLTRRWVLTTAYFLAVWMTFTGLMSSTGVLESPGQPPRAMVFMGGCNLIAVLLSFSIAATRLVRGLPIAALVGFHAFRLPLELVLHRWYVEGVLPVQMTYVGRNFDILTGVLAAVIGLWLWRKGPSRQLVWVFNVIGLLLLVNVAMIAILSSPFPFRSFVDGPAVLLAFHFPYGWILPMCVAPALAGHVLIFRWLWYTRASDAEA